MKSVWRTLKAILGYKGYLLAIGGIVLTIAKFAEDVLRFWKKVQNQNESPSGRPPAGVSDGEFTQPKSKPAKKPKKQPKGITSDKKLELEAEGDISPIVSSSTEQPTIDVIEDTDTYLNK